MSTTNVLLTGVSADRVAVLMNDWLKRERYGQLVEISTYGGGNATVQIPVWLGAFYGADVNAITRCYREAAMGLDPRSVELRMCLDGCNFRKVARPPVKQEKVCERVR